MSDFILQPNPDFKGVDGPLLLVIMDGVGLYRGKSEGYAGNAFDLANTPNLDRLMAQAPVHTKIKAHGPAVGLPGNGDMGNSEVGHNAMGAGRVFAQGAKLVNRAIDSGAIFSGAAWQELIAGVKASGGAFHLIGLLSDGNVHSHIDHVLAMLKRLHADGVVKVRLHPLADGRDVDPVTYHKYIQQLQGTLDELNADGFDGRVASGGGRMAITMDRYNADWEMVQRGWQTHVLGQGRQFKDVQTAIKTLRAENPGIVDQDLPPFVIVNDNDQPLGTIDDGDSVVFFNFRGDRAIEISRAFTEAGFDKFERTHVPNVNYAGMMEYDGDLHIPPKFLVEPPQIDRTVSQYLAENGVAQLAISETQKFGHVTYFWNGNNSQKFSENLETWIEIPSDRISFDKKPEMKANEICERLIAELESGKYKFLRVNFANGDMVGHTGELQAAIRAMETVDVCVGKLDEAVKAAGGTMIVTADHGNSEMMLEVNKKTGELKLDEESGEPVHKTSHTLNPVPWLLLGKHADGFVVNDAVDDPGLGNIAATLLYLLGYARPEGYLPPLVVAK